MSTEKDLNYWKANAEEDYKQVPISVLRYITELETAVKNCSIPLVSDPVKEAYQQGFNDGASAAADSIAANPERL